MKGAVFRITETILFGRYKILSTIGTGSTSTVYLAEHIKLKVHRAIKCIPKSTVTVTSLTLEATLLKNLSHSGIPLIFDVEEDEQFFYLIEEFIQGESLDVFLSHQSISHELLLKFGIQLCDIFNYLHHLMPYPILYQDLKPEHIIVCGNELKLIDFGIASFFTGSGETYQIYGTKDFAAPEALAGLPVSPLADIYSLGKILEYMSFHAADTGSRHLKKIIQKATSTYEEGRYETAHLLQEDLEKELRFACQTVSHLTKKITVIGSKAGVGTTHIAISLASVLNQNGCSALYVEQHKTDSLHAMLRENHFVKEHDGICCYRYFRGIPNYGQGIEPPDFKASVYVNDCGVYEKDLTVLDAESEYLFVLSGSPWDFEHTILAGKRLLTLEHVTFICNYNNQTAAKKLAAKLGRKVYCFPFDEDAFSCTTEKKQLFFHIFSFERRKKKFLNFIKRLLTNLVPSVSAGVRAVVASHILRLH